MNIPNKIGQFNRYTKKPSTMKYGYHYVTKIKLPFSREIRNLFVWLPEDYEFDNPEKRFPVIYFSDGQNLVDAYLCAYGEWELDKTAHKLKKEGYRSFIAVGLSCPKNPEERALELNPPYLPERTNHAHGLTDSFPYGDRYVNYMADEIKPIIDSLFFTLPNKENSGIGGSSMGGIMAFYAFLYRPDVFGFSLAFSPALFFYKTKTLRKIISSFNVNKDDFGKIFLYVGGNDFERLFTKPTIFAYYELRKYLPPEQLNLIVDMGEIHHEKAWAKYLEDALKMFLNN